MADAFSIDVLFKVLRTVGLASGSSLVNIMILGAGRHTLAIHHHIRSFADALILICVVVGVLRTFLANTFHSIESHLALAVPIDSDFVGSADWSAFSIHYFFSREAHTCL